MIKHTIKEMVTDTNLAAFKYYRKGNMYYNINVFEPENALCYGYTFPINLLDIGDATLNMLEKAIHLMRYIRLAIENNEMVCKISSTASNE